jgi:hypothetical protein
LYLIEGKVIATSDSTLLSLNKFIEEKKRENNEVLPLLFDYRVGKYYPLEDFFLHWSVHRVCLEYIDSKGWDYRDVVIDVVYRLIQLQFMQLSQDLNGSSKKADIINGLPLTDLCAIRFRLSRERNQNPWLQDAAFIDLFSVALLNNFTPAYAPVSSLPVPIENVPYVPYPSVNVNHGGCSIPYSHEISHYSVDPQLMDESYVPIHDTSLKDNDIKRGQFKLFLDLVRVINLFPVKNVVYIGAAPGYGTSMVAKYVFPGINFYLYDLRPIDETLFDFQTSNVRIMPTVQDIDALGLNPNETLLYSDVYTGSDDNYQVQIDYARHFNYAYNRFKFLYSYRGAAVARIQGSTLSYMYHTARNAGEMSETFENVNGMVQVPFNSFEAEKVISYYNRIIRNQKSTVVNPYTGCSCFDCAWSFYYWVFVARMDRHFNHVELYEQIYKGDNTYSTFMRSISNSRVITSLGAFNGDDRLLVSHGWHGSRFAYLSRSVFESIQANVSLSGGHKLIKWSKFSGGLVSVLVSDHPPDGKIYDVAFPIPVVQFKFGSSKRYEGWYRDQLRHVDFSFDPLSFIAEIDCRKCGVPGLPLGLAFFLYAHYFKHYVRRGSPEGKTHLLLLRSSSSLSSSSSPSSALFGDAGEIKTFDSFRRVVHRCGRTYVIGTFYGSDMSEKITSL